MGRRLTVAGSLTTVPHRGQVTAFGFFVAECFSDTFFSFLNKEQPAAGERRINPAIIRTLTAMRYSRRLPSGLFIVITAGESRTARSPPTCASEIGRASCRERV